MTFEKFIPIIGNVNNSQNTRWPFLTAEFELEVTAKKTENGRSVEMYSLCDSIEKYLIRLIEKSPNNTVTIQRGRVAEEFDCAPSQINYVLMTRFNVFKGFIVESRRGGSGYVKIQQIQMDRLEPVVNFLEVSEKDIKESEVESLLLWLEREGFITSREGSLMKAAIIDTFNKLNFDSLLSVRDVNILRSNILREMLLQVLKVGYDYEV